MALEHGIGLFTPVTSKIGVQQIHHGPEMAPFLDINLKQIPQVIERRAGASEMPLLLDGGGLGIALGDDQPAQGTAVFSRHLLPGRLAWWSPKAMVRPSSGLARKMPQR